MEKRCATHSIFEVYKLHKNMSDIQEFKLSETTTREIILKVIMAQCNLKNISLLSIDLQETQFAQLMMP